ncbi:MAG: hypothetical protein ACRDSZ_25775 [Pseudonocardiaceae bacterium]
MAVGTGTFRVATGVQVSELTEQLKAASVEHHKPTIDREYVTVWMQCPGTRHQQASRLCPQA